MAGEAPALASTPVEDVPAVVDPLREVDAITVHGLGGAGAHVEAVALKDDPPVPTASRRGGRGGAPEVRLHVATEVPARRTSGRHFFDGPDPVLEAAATRIQAMERGRQSRKRHPPRRPEADAPAAAEVLVESAASRRSSGSSEVPAARAKGLGGGPWLRTGPEGLSGPLHRRTR